MRTPGRTLTAAFAVIPLAAACGFLGAVGLSWQPAPPLPDEKVGQVEAVQVLFDSDDGELEVNFKAEVSPPVQLTAPDWRGVVTSAPCPNVLGSGDYVAKVDGLWRVAAHTSEPFFRPIGPTSRGDDVGMLRQMLVDLGFDLEPGPGVYSRDLGQAVSALSALIGQAPASSTFDPSWIVWLPTPDLTLADCKLRQGQQAVAYQTIAATSSAVRSIVISAASPQSRVRDATYDIAVGSEVLGTVEGSRLVVEDQSVVRRIAEALRLGSSADVTAEPDTSVGLDTSPAAKTGTLRLTEPEPTALVPASSIVSTGAVMCVLVGTTQAWVTTRVDIVDSRLGTVVVRVPDSSWSRNTTVLRNVSAMPTPPTCDES